MVKLIIFDMDGVLVDSEGAITQASIESLCETYGIEAKHADFKEFTGMGDDKFIAGVAKKYGKDYDVGLKFRAYEIYNAHKSRVKVFPRSKKLIHNFYNLGLKCAVASASDLVKVKVNIAKINLGKAIQISTTETLASPIKSKRPLFVIAGSDVTNKKPDPEIFLRAAEISGILPEFALVIEDAVSGVQAAKAAGMVCIGVTTSFDRKTLLNAGADFVIGKLYDAFDIVKSINKYNFL
ncbi:MAG: HAD family phosphatase [Oscillospiraceae bacterium]|nr:HAD family phosphatase [Oscillospiraceae bacterium]